MLRQYDAPRFRVHPSGERVGTIGIGTIVYLGAHNLPQGYRAANPWIVEAWLPREIGAAAMENGKYVNRYSPRGGHLAIVRSLRDGRRRRVADWFIRASLGDDW